MVYRRLSHLIASSAEVEFRFDVFVTQWVYISDPYVTFYKFPFSSYRECYDNHVIAGSLNIIHSQWALDESQAEVQDRKDHSMLEISEMHTHLGLNAAVKNILQRKTSRKMSDV